MKTISRAGVTVGLALVYFLLVTPVGLIIRLIRDPLLSRPDPAANSYWNYVGQESDRRPQCPPTARHTDRCPFTGERTP